MVVPEELASLYEACQSFEKGSTHLRGIAGEVISIDRIAAGNFGEKARRGRSEAAQEFASAWRMYIQGAVGEETPEVLRELLTQMSDELESLEGVARSWREHIGDEHEQAYRDKITDVCSSVRWHEGQYRSLLEGSKLLHDVYTAMNDAVSVPTGD